MCITFYSRNNIRTLKKIDFMRKLKLEELNRITPEEFKEAEKTNVAIILDNIRSLHNVGSAFRTSDAFLIEKIYLCGITGTPPNKEINKTALGATDSVQWEYVKETTEVIQKLKEDGWKIFCLEQTNTSLPLQNFFPQKNTKYAFVFGNEVFGVQEEVIAESDKCIEIPQFGTKHSFNVSVSIGIVLWDFYLKTALISEE